LFIVKNIYLDREQANQQNFTLSHGKGSFIELDDPPIPIPMGKEASSP